MTTLSKVIDRFAELHQQVTAFKPIQEEYEHLRKLLSAEADEEAPGEAVKLTGLTGYAEFGKPTIVRSVPAEKVPTVFHMIGQAAFLQVCKIGVADVEKLLTEPQQAKVFVSGAGARRLKSAGPLVAQQPRMFAHIRAA